MKKLFLITSLVFALNVHSQINYNIERSFLLEFLKENVLIVKTKEGKSIFDIEKLNIKVDSLNMYQGDFLFFKLDFKNNEIKSAENNLEISYSSSSCTEYVMAYDIQSKSTYRLQGFKGNDLLFLLRDIHKNSYSKGSVKETLSELNDLNIGGVDFKSIYKALRKLDFNAKCLKVCSDGKPAHGRLK
jgi:hypothetical protein